MTQPSTATESGPPLLVGVADGVATLTLNRPHAMNSLDLATKEALLAAVTEIAADPEVRCVVLTGTGRAFCVGQDLNEHLAGLRGAGAASLANTVTDHYNPIVETLLTMPKPVVAAVNGAAAGAGASLAFACDLRIVADTAGFNLAFAGIGLSCDTGISWTLPRLIGRAAALDLLYFPRTVPADEALALGLATRVVPAAELDVAVAEVAARLAAGPTLSYAGIRRSLTVSASAALPEALAHESEMMAWTGGSADHQAAVEAFLTKQPARFTGR